MRIFTVILVLCAACCRVYADKNAAQAVVRADEDAAHFRRGCSAVATDHFRVIHDLRPDEAEGIASVLEFAYKEFESRFGARGFSLQAPDAPLEWMCFRKPKSFSSFALATENADLSWLSGYYSSRTNRVAVVRPRRIRKWHGPGKQVSQIAARVEDGIDVGLVKIVHEAGHQLAFNTGLQRRGVMYPLWAAEGVALVFEDCVSEYLPGGRYSDARKKRLLDLYSQGDLMPLDEFVTLTRLSADHCEVDVYAQAWGFFVFLTEKRAAGLNDYFSYLHSLGAGARNAYRLRREFVESFGPVDELEREWSFFLELSAADRPFLCGAYSTPPDSTLK